MVGPEYYRGLQPPYEMRKDPIQNIFPAAQVALLRSRLDSHHADGTPKLLAMGVRDKRGFGGGFEPKRRLLPVLKKLGHEIQDFGCDSTASRVCFFDGFILMSDMHSRFSVRYESTDVGLHVAHQTQI